MHQIKISGEISRWGYSARWLNEELRNITGELEVLISSFGGDVFEGIDMFNLLRIYAKEKGKVTTVVNGKAMSIASLIFLAGDTKKAFENSTIMIHKAWTFLGGNEDELLKEAKILGSIDNILINEYNKYMSASKDEIKDILAKEGWFIGKEELEATGFIDEFIASGDEVQALALSKKAFANNMNAFSAKAKEEDVKHDLVALSKTIENMGGNNITAMPSDNVKLVNSNQGASMTEEEIQAMQEQNKVFSARVNTLETRETTLSAEVKNLTTALDTKNDEIKTINSKLSEVTASADKRIAANQTVIKEAFASGVASETTILAMMGAESPEDASKIALSAKEDASINQGDATTVKADAWAEFIPGGTK